MTAADRFFARLEPLAFDDDGTLENLATALTSPVEILEISRDTATLTAWESLFDPDVCPEALLDWLAVYNGVLLGPAVLTAAEKRYRIKQAAGRYRGTPRALIEDVQLELTGTKTVYIAFNTPDEWHYTVATIVSETTDAVRVGAAVDRQNPAGMLYLVINATGWTCFLLAPTLVAHRAGDNYVITAPDYPTCASVVTAFATCQDLLDNTPI